MHLKRISLLCYFFHSWNRTNRKITFCWAIEQEMSLWQLFDSSARVQTSNFVWVIWQRQINCVWELCSVIYTIQSWLIGPSMWPGSHSSSHYTAHLHSWPPPSVAGVIRSQCVLSAFWMYSHLCFEEITQWAVLLLQEKRSLFLNYLPNFPTIPFAFIHLTNEPKPSHMKCFHTKPQSIHFNFPFFSPPAMNERKNFRAPFLIDLPKFSPHHHSKNPLGTKGFLFCNNTKVISQVLFLAPAFSKGKRRYQ